MLLNEIIGRTNVFSRLKNEDGDDKERKRAKRKRERAKN